MRYTVVWTKLALNALARLWTLADDRQAVSNSADRIERLLKTDPERKGKPARLSFSILEDDPLSVLYTVDPGDRMVKVISVRRNK